MIRIFISLFFFCFIISYGQPKSLRVGAEQVEIYLSKLKDKRVGIVVNHTAMVGKNHLVDLLVENKVNVKKIFSPEHGFRGNEPDGELIKDATDRKTGIPIVSLYGNNKKPTAEQLADLDVIIFDIQDVGVRFYTYISTLHYLMEACAEQGKKLLVFDRPNPNGSYVDGPVLTDQAVKSFIGMHPIPTVHGLTEGELALMINGEGWLDKGVKCDVEVIPMKNWKHKDFYHVPLRPSPNLPNDQAIKLYPSLGLLEGTVISVGRGTQTPFQIIGNPLLKDMPFQFTPVSISDMSKYPPLENKLCYGLDLRNEKVKYEFTLKYVIDMYQRYPDKENFFIPYFDKLAGNTILKQQIKEGMTEVAIKSTWKKGLDAYREMRKKYLLYPN
jgi:uncharacterized protein YbbC (DUF1343 family)